VLLYDADRIEAAASAADERDLYQAQLDLFLDPNDPAVIAQARADGIPESWLEAARHSPVWKMAMEWKIAFPLHPEYRTLPMVWYVPPLSPIQSAAAAGQIGIDAGMPDVRSLRIPLRYLANMLTAGDEAPVALGAGADAGDARLHARQERRRGASMSRSPSGSAVAARQIEEMYQIMAIANYEDRFVIPTARREAHEDLYALRGNCGFSFGNGCSGGSSKAELFTPVKLFSPARGSQSHTPGEVLK
jgi:nitrate reductase beta subunit